MRIIELLTILVLSSPAITPEEKAGIDMVWVTESNVVTMKVHLRGEAVAVDKCWNDFIAAWFAFLDRDGNGKLSEVEFKRTPSPKQLMEQWNAGLYPRIGEAGGEFVSADTNRDNWISLSELDSYYQQGGVGPICEYDNTRSDGRSKSLNECLFKRLDRDGDGILTPSELTAAVGSLQILDINSDELWTADELLRDSPPPTESTRRPTRLFILGPEPAIRKTQLEKLLAFSPQLSKKQLQRRLLGKPDLEWSIGVGNATRVFPASKLSEAKEWEIDCIHETVNACSKKVMVRFSGRDRQRKLDKGIRDFYRQLFQTADRKRLGFVELGDLNIPAFEPLKRVFDLADRNNDGKLTEAELVVCVSLYTRTLDAHIHVGFSEESAGLFEILDINRDDRLTLRELHAASRCLRFIEHGKGVLRKADFPVRLDMAWSLGPPGFQTERGSKTEMNPQVPNWFKPMDRNGDGDISPKEFIGPLEEFSKLDLDGDGLISADEAIKAGSGKR